MAARLRRETAAEHEAVDGATDLRRVLADLSAYRDFLLRMGRVAIPLESSLGDGFARLRDVMPRPPLPWRHDREEWLASDWRDLTADCPHEVERLRTACRQWRATTGPGLDVPTTASILAGRLYVLEGSALGGLMIARLARQGLGLTDDRGARYLHGHGSQTRGRFAAWMNWLEEAVGPEVRSRDEAVAAARDTFAEFERSLRAELPPA